MMSEYVGFLRGFDLLSGCSDEELEVLSALVQPRNFASREVICRQGEAGSSCYLLVRGTVVVYKEIPGRGRLSFAPMLPGAVFGQVSLLDGRPRLVTCEAMGPVRLLELTGEAVGRLHRTRSRLAVIIQRELARSLVRQLRMANQRLGELEDQPRDAQDQHLVDLLKGMGGN
jgi:CRP-like cAMP-binding protein